MSTALCLLVFQADNDPGVEAPLSDAKLAVTASLKNGPSGPAGPNALTDLVMMQFREIAELELGTVFTFSVYKSL